ncbi:MAG: LysM peptidoglycan-binding domain-containing protein [Coriobacteriia bacterium]|nr:LysM peptidoglycan-binding domain-containing protein [Coriobacteriia bacterium]
MNTTVATGSIHRTSRPSQRPRTHSRVSQAKRSTGLELIVVALVAALLVWGLLASRNPHLADTAVQTVRVAPGDTLWSIAKSHPLPGMSTSQLAAAIATSNSLGSRVLVPGQRIAVPVAASDDPQMVASR